MIGVLRRLFAGPTVSAAEAGGVDADGIARVGDAAFDVGAACEWHEGMPHPDWNAVGAWQQTLPEALRGDAWTAAERAWLATLADALDMRLYESADSFLVSAQPPREAAATRDFVDTSQRRVRRMLQELAGEATHGKEIMLLFADVEDYYRYCGFHAGGEDELGPSAGMYLHGPCGHFVTWGDEMWRFEPTVVHEMTHAMLAHLPLPAWLNEGMGVNSEQRLTRQGADIWAVRELEAKHRRFWNEDTIQSFWDGSAYLRHDEGQELAYDLGRILVNGMCVDWESFKRFAAHAHIDDAGDAAAREQLHVDLGEYVRHFLEAPEGDWGPRPDRWQQAPERGAFAR